MNNRRNMQNRTFNKPKNRKLTLKKLGSYLYHFKGWFIVTIILTIFSNLFSLVGPLISGYAIGVIEKGKGLVDFKELYKYVILLLFFYGLSSLLSFIISILMIKISKKLVFKLRKDCYEHLLMLPVSYFDKNLTGDIINKMSYDIDTLNTSLSSDVISIITSIITVIGSLIMMIIISPILVLVFVITIPISLLFTRLMLKKTHKLFKKRSESLGILNGYVEEMITGNKTIKAYGQEKTTLDNFCTLNDTAAELAYKAEYYSSFTGPGVNFVNNLSLSLVCMFGSILFILGKLGLKEISSFVLYSRKFSGPINEVANIFTDIQSALAAAERVFSILEENEEIDTVDNPLILDEVEGKIEFEDVFFGYNETPIIKNLNLEVTPGETIAIVGPTGAGKTTIVNLLMRFYDVNEGIIRLDNHSIYEISRSSLRKSYAMVLQDTWLFQGTIYENIAYGKEDATKEEIIQAAKAAHIHNFIMSLPEEYDTILSEDGINISKGQKQLLTIARAMLLNAKMLILDEATSNVDTKTEVEIQDAMKILMKNKTCFIIAHRLSTIKNADLILVVKDGNIIEKGKHQELLSKNGFYAHMYFSQYN